MRKTITESILESPLEPIFKCCKKCNTLHLIHLKECPKCGSKLEPVYNITEE